MATNSVFTSACSNQRQTAFATKLNELAALRSQLARESLKLVSEEQQESFHQRLNVLEERVSQTIRELGLSSEGHARPTSWIELDAVRKSLPPDSLYIDIASYKKTDFRENTVEDAYYAAWLIPPADQGQVKVIPLGKADAIDSAIRAVREAMQQSPALIEEVGESTAEQRIRLLLGKLSELVLQPLLKDMGTARQLIISPDASLWLVPWETFVLPDERYAIEEYQISYVVSGRNLLAKGTTLAADSPPTIFADPAFDLDPATIQSSKETAPSNHHRASSLSTLGHVKQLPGTAAEARAILPFVEKYTQSSPKLFLEKQSLEENFKQLCRPPVLVMSTHGFFFEDQEGVPKNLNTREATGIALTKDGQPVENPLLRSGLLLAGCNRRASAPDHVEDGVLTALEITSMDLRSTRLVVLSACDTGLGEVHNGEGVAGLRQAFLLAGAEAVVSSLWKVDDLETSHLIKGFFSKLAEGHGRASALRKSQLSRIGTRRELYDSAHPYYWASFTLTGAWD